MEGLQLLKLRIENYRQYKGVNEIDLSTDGRRHINVIQGENGTGKSNLLNAVTLCLFGDEMHQENNVEEDAILPYVSLDLIEDLSQGEAAEGMIEIEIGHEEPEYIFTRRFRTFSVGKGYNDVKDDLQVKRKSGKDWETEENPITTRNEIIPVRVASYFFFDGEQLSEFFNQGYQDRVKEAILDISHIQLLDRSLYHLNQMRSDIQSTARDYGGRPEEIQQEIESIENEIENKEDELEGINQDIEDTDFEIEKIDDKLQDITDEEVKALYEKREMREGQLDEKKKRRGKVIDGAKDILLDAGPAVYSYSALTFAQDELDRLSEKGELPPKIQQQFIDELIERGECICGESLDENPKKVENLLELQNEVTTITQENFEGKPEIKNLLNRMEEKTEDLLEERQELTAIEGDIEGINSELSEVKEALQTADVPEEVDVGALEAQREELRDQRDKLIARRSRVTDDISDLESKKTTKETELREEVKKEERYQELSKKLEFVDAAIRDLEGIRSQILSDIRGRTESNIDGYFNELIWKEQEYNIQLTEDYHLRVLDEHGENQLGSLSAGETQVLALSFMAALSQISGFQAPILIDTPLGRISGEPKKKIAQSLPDYLDDSQVTFLMTDQEYSADVRGLMENEVDREYQLDFADGKTEVVDLA